MSQTRLPAYPGTYLLLLRARQAGAVTVGRLGGLELQAGFYLYLGSAFGGGGLGGRLRRQLSPPVKRHWHVDYLRGVTELAAVWYSGDPHKRECAWAGLLRGAGLTQPWAGFGASDCACPSHLFYLPQPPTLTWFQALVATLPGHAPVLEYPGV